MGLNAQTSVPVFTAGQVLTAQQQKEINTGIPVFATTVTRDAAFGGTGEKTLAQGQYAYIEATSALMVYTGSAWINAGGGLTLITAQAIGSAVGSVTVSSCFSSTYDNYLVTVNGGVGSVAGDLRLQLNGTTSGYYYSIIGNSWNATASNAGSTSIASIPYMGTVETNSLNASITIKSPNLAKRTEFNANYMNPTASYVSSGFLNNLTQYTGLVLAPDSGTLTGGTIRVYGYQTS
jgi:hypothetical protein